MTRPFFAKTYRWVYGVCAGLMLGVAGEAEAIVFSERAAAARRFVSDHHLLPAAAKTLAKGLAKAGVVP